MGIPINFIFFNIVLFNFSEDYLFGRQLNCRFKFNQDENVTEMTHNLFKNFNATNNKFDLAYFEFFNDGETSNFMFDNATSGLLEVKFFGVFDISVENGLLPMTESAVSGSINSLEGLWINTMDVNDSDESYTKLAFSENFLFTLGLSKLKFLGLIGIDWNKYQIPQETFNRLETLIVDLTLDALPEMPNLKNLRLFLTEETSLSSVLKKVPNLEILCIFELLGGKLEPILPGTFEEIKYLDNIDLSGTSIVSIDLTGVQPTTFVILPNSITNLPEQNFRPFIESGVRNYLSTCSYTQGDTIWGVNPIKVYGGLAMGGLECSCDLKWLCEVPHVTEWLQIVECADGTSLELALERICNLKCK